MTLLKSSNSLLGRVTFVLGFILLIERMITQTKERKKNIASINDSSLL